ncbi:oligosaccharide flippase family protein [Peribacillus sp. 1P06PB]|uniref:oligosaccharide flippase family protein n=1 Tax=Peribacillus sp. 1P06PB TaxID=3132296 RepID=UPI0039A38762
MVLGVLYSLLQFGSEDESKRNIIYKYGLKIGVAFNLFLCILILIYSFSVNLPNQESKISLVMMGFMPFLIFGFQFIQNYLRTGLYNVEFSKQNNINTLLLFVFSLFGAVVYGIKGVIIGTYLAYLISIILGVRFIRSKNENIFLFKSKKNLKRSEKIDFVKYSLYSLFNNAIAQLIFLIDIYLIGLLTMDTDLLATYKTATLIPFALNFIPLSIMTFIYPYFAKHRENKDWVKENFKRLQKILIVINIFIVSILYLISPYLIQLLFGDEYSDIVSLFRILLLGYLIGGSLRTPAGNVLAMIRKVKFLFWTNITMGCINICLNVVLIKKFSIYGAAVSTVIIIFITSIIYNIYIYHILRNNKKIDIN